MASRRQSPQCAHELDIIALADRQAVLDIKHCSAVLNVSVSTLRRWVRVKYFPPPVVLGSNAQAQIHRWSARVVRDWMEQHDLLAP